MLKRLREVCAALVLLTACGGSATDGPTAADNNTAGSGGQTSTGCSRNSPQCIEGCGSNLSGSAECVDGSWRCPNGLVDAESCPPKTCSGNGPLCLTSCFTDILETAECDDGTWRCSDGHIDAESCACHGPPQLCDPNWGDDDPAPCEGSNFCECWARQDECQIQSDSCICHCDYECSGEPSCDCDCGGGDYLGCTARP